MKIFRILILVALFHLLPLMLPAQTGTYILNGSATQNTCNCYTLTPAANTQSGSVWNATKINLNNPFDFVFNVFLGCADAGGADGIVFMLQPISTSVGTTGEGMGFEGISPSIGISLDTWQNFNRNDPAYDHISIQANGMVTHGSDLAGPVQASPTDPNIEDCRWHTFRIVWNPVTKILSTYFDGNFMLQANVDLIANIFNNDPMVYWGFTAGTGGANNLQQFCTALNPGFNTNLPQNTTCFTNNVTVAFNNISESFAPIASYHWDFGDGITSTLAAPPPHTYTAPGLYPVKLAITGLDGCKSDTLKKIIAIGDYPVASFDIFDTCSGTNPRIIDRSTVSVGTINEWNWILDGNPISVSQLPQLPNLWNGGHNLELTVKSNYGCASTAVRKSFLVKARPAIEAQSQNGCVNTPISFQARQLDNATFVTGWHWDFGDNHSAFTQNPTYSYSSGGDLEASVFATSSNGCNSDTVKLPLVVHEVVANAGNDTVILKNIPYQIPASFYTSDISSMPNFLWSPATGLDDVNAAIPTTTLTDDQTYYFTVTTADGCIAKDTINIKVFKGSSIYVPTGFTPNNDGLNERLRPYYIGIKSLEYFKVFNRWGEQVFTTKNLSEGWNGQVRGVNQATGTYVWMLRATDYAGKVYNLKGSSTIIR